MESEKREVEFKLAKIENALEMVAFHNAYYGTKRKPEHWIWEYQKHLPDKAVPAFATDHGKLMATQCMIPIYLYVGDKCILSGKSENTLMLPDYRSSGIMQGLYEFAVNNCIERGVEFIWGFTGAIKAFERFGFTHFPGIKVMGRFGNLWVDMVIQLRTRKPLWRKLASLGLLVLLRIIHFQRAPSRIREQTDYKLRENEPCDEHDMQKLYERLRQKNGELISIRYDREYLQWRIREHPFIKYTEYLVYQGDKLRAYSFVALVEGIVSISDLTSEDTYATSLLLRAILKDYSKKAGRFHFLGNPKDLIAREVFEQLQRFGFFPIGNWNLVLKDLANAKNKEISEIRNWHINGLWTEGYSM